MVHQYLWETSREQRRIRHAWLAIYTVKSCSKVDIRQTLPDPDEICARASMHAFVSPPEHVPTQQRLPVVVAGDNDDACRLED